MSKKNKKKYYHASKTLFKPGDHLVPGKEPNYLQSCSEFIYLTEAPEPHYTIADKANKENWYVYEVTPTGKIYLGICWDEWYTKKACIVKSRLGNTRGISKSGKSIKNEDEKSSIKYLKEELQYAKNAIKDEEIRKQWNEDYSYEPEEVIEELQAKIKFKNAKTSKAIYNYLPPCKIFNTKPRYQNNENI